MNLIKIKGNTYMLPGAVHIGVIVGHSSECIAVDTGIDAQIGKKLLRALDEEGLTLKAIVNTHAHADHIGGNAPLQARTGARCYASPMEAAMIRCTELEGMYLYSAMPPKPLQTRFLKAQPTPEVEAVGEGALALCGVNLELVALHGHSPGQMGVVTEDGVMFAGDALMASAVWEKYVLCYLVDVAKALESLDKLAGAAYTMVAAHSGLVDDAAGLIAYNREAILARADETCEMLKTPMTREQLVRAFIQKYALSADVAQCVLLHSTVSAYTAYLLETGRVTMTAQDGCLVFSAM